MYVIPLESCAPKPELHCPWGPLMTAPPQNSGLSAVRVCWWRVKVRDCNCTGTEVPKRRCPETDGSAPATPTMIPLPSGAALTSIARTADAACRTWLTAWSSSAALYAALFTSTRIPGRREANSPAMSAGTGPCQYTVNESPGETTAGHWKSFQPADGVLAVAADRRPGPAAPGQPGPAAPVTPRPGATRSQPEFRVAARLGPRAAPGHRHAADTRWPCAVRRVGRQFARPVGTDADPARRAGPG